MAKQTAKRTDSQHIADQIAEYIGKSLGELLNRKNALTKQMADVEEQITVIRERIARQLGQYVPTKGSTRKGRSRSGGKRTRVVSDATRAKMAASARKRWARSRREQGARKNEQRGRKKSSTA